MDHQQQTWWVLRLTINADIEDVVSASLWDAGTVGISSKASRDSVEVSAYFTTKQTLHDIEAALRAALARQQLSVDSLIQITQQELVEQDWLEKWKEGYHALRVGQRFLITPSWEACADADDRIVIQIDPGMAFGTGTHHTTQLCLVALETYWRGGRFLDLGTGTGILAMAAARLFPDAHVMGIDIDPVAIEVAQENLVQNELAGRVELQTGGIETVAGLTFDVVVANLTADVIEALLTSIVSAAARPGHIILSGILVEQEPDICEKLNRMGLTLVERFRSDEWVALVVRHGTSA